MPLWKSGPKSLSESLGGCRAQMPFGNPTPRVLAKARRVPGADALWKSGPRVLAKVSMAPGAYALWKSGPRVLAKVSMAPGADALWDSSTKSLSESLEGAGP